MARKILKKYKFDLHGDKWTSYLITDKAMEAESEPDEDMQGYCEMETRKVVFRESSLSPELVRHEIAHAFIHYTATAYAGLDTDSLEEVFCQLFAQKGEHMLELSNTIHRKLKI